MSVNIICRIVAIINVTIRNSVAPGKAEDDHNENYKKQLAHNSVAPGKAEDDHAENF